MVDFQKIDMKLYTAVAPNPNRVNIFVAEKAIALPTVWLSVIGGETRSAEHLARNGLGEVPVLALDDGTHLTETFAICRYLDACFPDRPLMGATPREAAKIEMWSRRMEQQICAPVGDFALHTFEYFADKIVQIPAYADTRLALQDKRWSWLDAHLSDGRTFVVDDALSFADLVGTSALFVSRFVNHRIPDRLHHVKRWERAMLSLKGWSQ